MLQFCNFARLREEAQDNRSKRTAIEKEPLILENDKEDQSKYYLSYPKPPVLGMKWKNHDINVVECANIPNFPPLLNRDQENQNGDCSPADGMLTPTVKFDIFVTFHICFCPGPPWSSQLRATGVLNSANALSLGTNSCQKMEHGNFEQRTSSKKAV